MVYYFSKTMNDAMLNEVCERGTAALNAEGFGVLTQIDVQATLRAKIGVEFRPYHTLGVCNPSLADKALSAEGKIGTMLVCNVIVQDLGSGRVEAAAFYPQAAMERIDNAALASFASEVAGKLEKVIASLN